MIEIKYSGDVSLWFARDEKENIIIIDEVNENNIGRYNCPICSSEVVPKAIKRGAKVSSHFAHIDRSKCDSETMIHWWFKHKFLSKGDAFIVKADTEKEYIVESIVVEKSYKVSAGDYQPDVTIKTTTGETIYFEMAYSNCKKVEEYLDIWMELSNIVVEVDIKDLIKPNPDSFKSEFKALFYDGKCFNTKRNDIYYNTIGKRKEHIFNSGSNKSDLHIKERIKALDWFWTDIGRYTKHEVDIEYMVDLIEIMTRTADRGVIISILGKARCKQLIDDYAEFKATKVFEGIKSRHDQADIDSVCEIKLISFSTIPTKVKIKLFDNVRNYNHEFLLLEKSTEDIILSVSRQISYSLDIKNRGRVYKQAKNNKFLRQAIKDVGTLLYQEGIQYAFDIKFLEYNGSICVAVTLEDGLNILKKYKIDNNLSISVDTQDIRKKLWDEFSKCTKKGDGGNSPN